MIPGLTAQDDDLLHRFSRGQAGSAQDFRNITGAVARLLTLQRDRELAIVDLQTDKALLDRMEEIWKTTAPEAKISYRELMGRLVH